MRTLALIGVSVAVAALACAPLAVGVAQEMHSHPLPEKLGTVSFATSCAKTVGPDFNRAVALLHSFSYTAAEQAFRDIAAADPSCAMAHWGMAISYFHPLWSPPGADDLRRGQAEIALALAVHPQSARERQFIAAAAAFYADYEHSPHAIRARAYEEAMSVLARGNPSDTESQVFFALSLLATAPPDDRSHANQKRAAAILEPIYRDHPEHPGVAHYLIHAYDNAELAPHGLAVARAYSKIAPSAPHALHMPSHIFTRLGLWEDSVASNSAARTTAHAQGVVSEELHAMDYLTYAYLQLGRPADAERVVASLGTMSGFAPGDFISSYAATAMPVRLVIERQNWDAGAALQAAPGSAPQVAALVYWARAVSNARAGRGRAASEDIDRLDGSHRQLQATGNVYWAQQVDLLRQEADSWRLFADAHAEEAIRGLRAAADQEDAVEKLPVTPGPIVPAREQLADMLLALDRPAEALLEYRAALRSAPGRRGAQVGAEKAATRARQVSQDHSPVRNRVHSRVIKRDCSGVIEGRTCSFARISLPG